MKAQSLTAIVAVTVLTGCGMQHIESTAPMSGQIKPTPSQLLVVDDSVKQYVASQARLDLYRDYPRAKASIAKMLDRGYYGATKELVPSPLGNGIFEQGANVGIERNMKKATVGLIIVNDVPSGIIIDPGEENMGVRIIENQDGIAFRPWLDTRTSIDSRPRTICIVQCVEKLPVRQDTELADVRNLDESAIDAYVTALDSALGRGWAVP